MEGTVNGQDAREWGSPQSKCSAVQREQLGFAGTDRVVIVSAAGAEAEKKGSVARIRVSVGIHRWCCIVSIELIADGTELNGQMRAFALDSLVRRSGGWMFLGES